MRYDLCTSESKEKIGDIILDESPTVGSTVSSAEATWRVTGIKWMANVDNNSQSSGLLCVERIKSAGVNDAPILLLQWLNAPEYELTKTALSTFGKEVKILHPDVQTKADAMAAIERWLDGNSNAQFLFIGTHGDKEGIGPSYENGVAWSDLRSVLKKAVRPVALWLGACKSAYAAKAWSPVKGYAPIKYIVGFPVPICGEEIEKVLHQLLEMTGINPITFVDEEIPKLRKAVPKTTVLMHYKALTKAGRLEYVDVDEFPKVVGMTLKQYLEL